MPRHSVDLSRCRCASSSLVMFSSRSMVAVDQGWAAFGNSRAVVRQRFPFSGSAERTRLGCAPFRTSAWRTNYGRHDRLRTCPRARRQTELSGPFLSNTSGHCRPSDGARCRRQLLLAEREVPTVLHRLGLDSNFESQIQTNSWICRIISEELVLLGTLPGNAFK